MVAGLEHLGAWYGRAVVGMIVGVEPGLRSLDIGRAIIGWRRIKAFRVSR